MSYLERSKNKRIDEDVYVSSAKSVWGDYGDDNNVLKDLGQKKAEMGFADLIRGRRVALVGPSESLVGKGDEIDSYDLVVRLNNATHFYPFESNLSYDIGSRFDVLYCLGWRDLRNANLSNNRPNLEYLKFLVSAEVELSWIDNEDPFIEDWIRQKHFRDILTECGVQYRYAKHDFLYGWLNGYRPRMGFIALADLLMFEPAELKLFGFTFYHGGGHRFKPYATIEPQKHPSGYIDLHDGDEEIRVLKLLMRSESTIKIDEILSQVIEDVENRDNI
ncbi:glycosyltransferase family 29 protein [Puniceicoccaceae bacterium K14]|nr:glycosyltransferase family 29 protein [Puniceicoccaceae bacterium K14]